MSTLLSDGSVVDLVEGGRNVPLTKALAQEFYDKALKARLEESKAQVQAVINGIHKTFDKKFLRMISWRFLEHRVVGACEVSVDRLKEITAYRNCSAQHEVVKRFWSVLEALSNEEKVDYLRFVWGRTRLPNKEEEVLENHTIELDDSKGNDRLPIGRTCFFKLQLPAYSSASALKAKLLYAIQHCKAIDADFDRAGAPVQEEAPGLGEREGPGGRERALSEESDGARPNLFGGEPPRDHHEQYSSDPYGGEGGGGGGEEEEEEE